MIGRVEMLSKEAGTVHGARFPVGFDLRDDGRGAKHTNASQPNKAVAGLKRLMPRVPSPLA